MLKWFDIFRLCDLGKYSPPELDLLLSVVTAYRLLQCFEQQGSEGKKEKEEKERQDNELELAFLAKQEEEARKERQIQEMNSETELLDEEKIPKQRNQQDPPAANKRQTQRKTITLEQIRECLQWSFLADSPVDTSVARGRLALDILRMPISVA